MSRRFFLKINDKKLAYSHLIITVIEPHFILNLIDFSQLKIEQLISDLKKTFRETFPERELSSQISSLKALVGYPSWIDNTTLINSYYREVLC